MYVPVWGLAALHDPAKPPVRIVMNGRSTRFSAGRRSRCSGLSPPRRQGGRHWRRIVQADLTGTLGASTSTPSSLEDRKHSPPPPPPPALVRAYLLSRFATRRSPAQSTTAQTRSPARGKPIQIGGSTPSSTWPSLGTHRAHSARPGAHWLHTNVRQSELRLGAAGPAAERARSRCRARRSTDPSASSGPKTARAPPRSSSTHRSSRGIA